MQPSSSGPHVTALHDIRLLNDQHGNLQIGLFGAGPFPIMVWTVYRDHVAELLDIDLGYVPARPQGDEACPGVIQLTMDGGAGFHLPGHGPRHPIDRRGVESGDPGADQGSPHVPPAGTGS